MKTYAEKFIGNIETDELDLIPPYYDDKDDPNEILTSSKVIAQSGISMSINDVILILNELKEKGANRVYIDYHEDHQTYIFSGVELKEI